MVNIEMHKHLFEFKKDSLAPPEVVTIASYIF
jgi:hypothetical protein